MVEPRLSPLAVAAVVLAAVAALAAFGSSLVVAASLRGAAAAVILLGLLQLLVTPAALGLAYATLLTCRIHRPVTGRGLAWAALALCYSALLLLLNLLAALPGAGVALILVAATAGLHVLIFACESPFAKQAVTSLVIGSTLLSLVSCWLLQSREQSRRLRCGDNLRKLGTQLGHHAEFGRPAATWSPSKADPWTADPLGPPVAEPSSELSPEIRKLLEELSQPKRRPAND